jgi:adenylate cyclase
MRQSWLGQTKKLRRVAFGLACLVTALMLVLAWTPSVLSRLETLSLDVRFKIRGERQPSGHVVLVAIDEKSLRESAQWPWPRDLQAQLVEKIHADRPVVIGLDLIYSESESTPYLRDLQEIQSALEHAGLAVEGVSRVLKRQFTRAQTDPRLVQSLSKAGNVVLAYPFLVPDSTFRLGELAASSQFSSRSYFMTVKGAGSPEALQPYEAVAVAPPLPQFTAKAMGMGHVYSIPDWDGVTRYEYLALRYGGQYYPSFALELARTYLGVPRDRMILKVGEGIQLGRTFIPTDQKSRLVINYLGRERSFQYVSATDVLHDRVPPGTFRDRLVIVGTAALGTYDQKISPFSNNYPGFEKNATVVENILEEEFIKKTLWSGPLDASIILFFGLGLGYLLPRQGALAGAWLALGVLGIYGVMAQYLFEAAGVWIEGVVPLLTIVLTFLVIVVLRFMTEERQSKEIRTIFSSYVSPRVVEELVKDPAKATTLGGQRRELTMLFADVVNFTRLNEEREAEEVVAQLNEYLSAMTEVIFHWNGTLDKFVGDGIVAFWGAPLEQPSHVELAVKCALHMRKRLEELQGRWRSEGKIVFSSGIGINTGFVLVGNIGAEGKKMDYTVIGDHVNLTARVEALTREFGCPIIVTEHTARYLRSLIHAAEVEDNRGRLGHVALRKLGAVKVKGKDHAVVLYGLQSLDLKEPSYIDEQPSLSPVPPIASHRLLK